MWKELRRKSVDNAARSDEKLSRQDRSMRWHAVSPSIMHCTVLSTSELEGEVGGEEVSEGGDVEDLLLLRRGSLREATPLNASQPASCEDVSGGGEEGDDGEES